MIGSLEGVLVAKHPPRLLLEVNGVGYEIEAPMSTFYVLPDLGARMRLVTHLVVREDAHQLFGFASDAERSLFRSLLKVNGVGAKVALAILSGISVDAFTRCVLDGDVATLTRVPGIGRKTAERVIVEMRDRVSGDLPPAAGDAPLAGGAPRTARDEALAALVALGYKPAEAAKMLDKASGDSAEDLIKAALQGMVRR